MEDTIDKEVMKVPELRFSGFEGVWEENKLGDVCIKVGSGKTPKGGDKVYQQSGIPFIRSQNVYGNKLFLDDVFISEKVHEEMKGSKVLPNDILLNITGGSIGRSCVVPQDFKEGNVNQHVSIIRLKSFESKFLQSILSSWRGQKLIFQGQTGSGREGLNFQSIRSFKIHFPTLPEQQKIATFLTAVDRKIEQLSRQKALLEQYKKGVMQRIFSREVRFRDDDGGAFPDWEEKRLGEFLIKFEEKTTKNNQYPVLTSSRNGIFFQKDYYSGGEVASKDNTGYNIVPRGYFTYRHMSDDLIFRINKNTIVDFGIVSTLYPVFTTKNINEEFLLFILNNGSEFKKYALIQKQGGSRTYMYFSKLQKLQLNLPPLSEQQKITNYLSAIDTKISQVDARLGHAKSFKKGLLQQMFV